MIVDTLENIALYTNSCPYLEKAAALVEKIKGLEKGRYDDGEIYGMVQEMETVPLSEKKFEAHIKYIDLHYIIEGVEVIDWKTLTELTAIDEYNPEKDIRWYKNEAGAPVVLNKGMFCITYPSDGHKTGCHFDDKCSLKKIVVKIPVNN